MATIQERQDVQIIRDLIQVKYPNATIFNDKRHDGRRVKLWVGTFKTPEAALEYARDIATKAKEAGVKAKITPSISPPSISYRPTVGCPVWILS